MYNQSSVLRTMELILGLRPMTQFDAAARPLTAAFATTAKPAPYTAEKPRISLTDQESGRIGHRGAFRAHGFRAKPTRSTMTN